MISTRRQVADLAIELVGGVTGYTREYDPFGCFAIVTEGRQTSWKDSETGQIRHYSACEDLLSRVVLQLCGFKQGMAWCNRVDGGNDWIPGQNLLRIKRYAAYAWKNYGPHAAWDVGLGDGVQVQGNYGPHTFVITELRYDAQGDPASCDHADYGQFPDPDGSGPEPAGHGCRLYVDAPIRRDREHRWTIGGNRIIGRLDVMAVRDRELGQEAPT
jgi:hypothetical protein